MGKTMLATSNEDDETNKEKRTKTINKLLERGHILNTLSLILIPRLVTL